MDDKRASTYVYEPKQFPPKFETRLIFSYMLCSSFPKISSLEAVENFIQSQKLLLEQAEQDIARMRELKSYVLLNRDVDPEDLLNQVCYGHNVAFFFGFLPPLPKRLTKFSPS